MIKSIFNRIISAIERSTISDYERYLRSATDLVDLEQRMRYEWPKFERRPEDYLW